MYAPDFRSRSQSADSTRRSEKMREGYKEESIRAVRE